MEGEGREGKGEEEREGKEDRLDVGGRGGRKGRKEGIKGRGWERELVPPSHHDLFATHPCQHSGRREASFELPSATMCVVCVEDVFRDILCFWTSWLTLTCYRVYLYILFVRSVQIPDGTEDEAVRIFLEFERLESAIKGISSFLQ